jgi:hypothetical protein
MKRLALILTAVSCLGGSTAMAQDTNGRGAAACTKCATDPCVAWGVGIGALVVIGIVVGIVAASASQTKSYSQ